jgi:hypothetical protein
VDLRLIRTVENWEGGGLLEGLRMSFRVDLAAFVSYKGHRVPEVS